MTNINFLKTEVGWQGFKAYGHTGFANRGEDVVCAAVSALTQTTILGLKKVLEIECKVKVQETDGLLICLLPDQLSAKQWELAQIVFRILYEGLVAIQAEYGKYVRVKEVPYREDEFTTVRL